MTATAENPSETRDQTPEQTISNFDRTRIELALTESNKTEGIFTAVAIANASGVSDTAVRKALKAFKQVLPESILMADNKRLTELAQALMAQYFSRPEGMTGAEWIYELRQPQPVQTPSLPEESRYAAARDRSERMHPLTLALSVLVFSLSLAIPLAILGAILQPQPEYHYHQRW